MKEFITKLQSISPSTWARTICLLLTLINQVLAVAGKNVIPFAENDVYQVVSVVATIVAGITAWWKNNSFTSKAIKADEYLDELRSQD